MKMKWPIVLQVLAGLLLVGGGVAIGQYLSRETVDDLARRNRILAEKDILRQIELDENRVAYEKIVIDFASAKEVNDFLKDQNNQLGSQVDGLIREVQNKNREITHLTTTIANLRVELDIALGDIVIQQNRVDAEIYHSRRYEDGSITTEGNVTVYLPTEDEPEARGNASLVFDVEMRPTVVISRDKDGLGQCDVTFGDMPVYVSRLQCVDNIGYTPPVRSPLSVKLPSFALGSLITLGVVGAISLF